MQSMPEPCAICGGRLQETVLSITQPDRFESALGVSADGYRRDWMPCGQCGALTDQHPPASAEALKSIADRYSEIDFQGTSIRAKFDRVMGLPPEQSDNAQRVARIHEFLNRWPLLAPRDRRALDVGAGMGVFLAQFLREGWTGVAVEPDPVAAAHLREIATFEIVEGLYFGEPERGQFDLITLNKVVEHVREPVEMLRQIARGLKPESGVLYVEVPDLVTAAARPPQDNALGALHHHLYHPRSLAELFDQAGLESLQTERVLDPSGKLTVCGFAVLPAALHRWAQLNAP